MTSKLFNLHNVNNQALVVPPEYGADEDDTYFGSIGDATAKHVSSLSHADRQLWQELIHTRSGNIFRAEPSLNQHDADPFALRGKELDKELATMKEKAGDRLDDSTLAAIKEAFQAEAERREQSEDAYDQAELIPYHMMEQYPGMEKYIDIPQTPKDWLIYMGNTRQQFMDEFPEDHPNSSTILRYIRMLDRDEVNEGWYSFVRNCLTGELLEPYVVKALNALINGLETKSGNEDEYVQQSLLEIDTNYRIEYLNIVAQKARGDYILQLLVHKEKEWEEDAKRGFNVYSSIKTFGHMLFESYRDKMKGHHWARYRSARDKHAPKVIARGIDINRCGVYELMCSLCLSRKAATKLWHARPFDSLGHVRNQGYIDRSSFTDSKETDVYLTIVEKAAGEAEEKSQLGILSAAATQLIREQQLRRKGCPEQHEWRMIWSYYRILRDELTRKLNERQKKDARQEEPRFRLLEDLGEGQSSATSTGGEVRQETREEGPGEERAETIRDSAVNTDRGQEVMVH